MAHQLVPKEKKDQAKAEILQKAFKASCHACGGLENQNSDKIKLSQPELRFDAEISTKTSKENKIAHVPQRGTLSTQGDAAAPPNTPPIEITPAQKKIQFPMEIHRELDKIEDVNALI